MEKQEIIACLESLLFASGKAVDKKILIEIMNISKEELIEAAESLKNILLENFNNIFST